MSQHALQVSFHRVPPSERLVALAAARYREIRRVRPGPGECIVSLETREGERRLLAHAVVQFHEDGGVRVTARASHKNPRVALDRALEDVQAQLGVSTLEPPRLVSCE